MIYIRIFPLFTDRNNFAGKLAILYLASSVRQDGRLKQIGYRINLRVDIFSLSFINQQ